MAKAYSLGLLGAGKLMILADAASGSYVAGIDDQTSGSGSTHTLKLDHARS